MRSAGIVAISLPGILGLLTSCAVGPDYQRPTTATPVAYVEAGPWKEAAPRDHLPKNAWWKIYGDPILDQLAAQATAASHTIQGALARRDQARALARVERASLFPELSASPSAGRSRTTTRRATTGSQTANGFSLPLDLSYEVDLWGRLRRGTESARARAEASEADYQNVLLGVQADVARSYFSLRALEVEHSLLMRNVDSRRRSLEIVKKRFDLGASGDFEVSLAQTELATAEGDLIANEQDRSALRLSLAVLVGTQPENFILAVDSSPLAAAPAMPLALPSELLERRPDVASAERILAATNAQIGVAKAAFFPSIQLLGTAGYASDELDSLLNWDSRVWSLGGSLAAPLFQAGRIKANYERTQAIYVEALANYQQSVLIAFRDVEISLSDLRRLSDRGVFVDRAVSSSRRAADLVAIRYRSGQIGYLDVTAAERTAIANERLAVQLRAQQLIASVLLVKALGGGW